MATFTAIPEKTQTANAMKRVIDYVIQDKKTIYDGIKLVGGQNCVPESAYQEFMATKHQYGKANGVFFKQYVQSFKPDCGTTPQMIHQIGLETAKVFDGYEVLVATHIDRDHWHNHFVVNSVSCETGLKIQINEKGLEELRHKSDEICQQFGLEILAPYQKPKQKSINQREYRTALRGNSKKLKLTNAIDYAVAMSRTKQQFTDQMQKLGYGVKWIDRYKYITYTTPDGQRFRDNRLLEDKYLKKNMEELFAYEYSTVKTNQSNTSHNRTDGISLDRADTTAIPDAQAGAVQSAENISTIGNAIVENTDLISELPTHQDLNDLTVRVLRPYTEKMEETASSKMNSIQYSVEDKLLKQTDILKKSIQSELRNMMTELKAKDLTPWKLKLKWILTGAILPSTLLIWQLICR